VRIPRIFHQIWLGPDPPPEHENAYRASWGEYHPGWEVRLWREDELPDDCRRAEVYQRLRHPAERADILRLELLWRYGGVYVDTDFECRRSIEPLLEGVELFLGDMKPGRTNNAIIGAIPQHPLIGRALDELRPVEWHGVDPKAGTGPHFLDALLRPERNHITIFPPPVFYPSTEEERASAYAVHHTARSWVDVDGLRYRLAKAERRQEAAEETLRLVERELEIVRTGSFGQRTALRARRGRRRGRALLAAGKLRMRSLRFAR
jgi:mannosyltransferase OCH1-like enzyme